MELLWGYTGLLVLFFTCVNAATKDIDMSYYCDPRGRGNTVDISDATAGVLYWNRYPPNEEGCMLSLLAAAGKQIFLQFTDINIKGKSGQFCHDVLYVKQGSYGATGGRFTPDSTWEVVCAGSHHVVYTAYERSVTFILVSAPDGGGHFRIRYTVYHHAYGSTCNGFKCFAHIGDMCIDDSLMCDGINHCGQGLAWGTDESTDGDGGCAIDKHRKIMKIVGITCGCVGGVILLIVGVCVYRRYRPRSQPKSPEVGMRLATLSSH